MEKNIRYSIIIPIYNASKFLRECLDSVLVQEVDDYEVILVNDGSTDDSLSICKEYAARDSRFIIIDKENEGQFHTRRAGMSIAQGEYLLFLDSDDYWENNLLSVINQSLIRFDYPDIMVFNYNCVDENNNFINEVKHDFSYDKLINRDSYVNEVYMFLLGTGSLNSLCKEVIKRKLIKPEKDLFAISKIRIGEDRLENTNFILNSHTIVFLPYSLYNYRLNEAGVMSSTKKEKINYDTMLVNLMILDKISPLFGKEIDLTYKFSEVLVYMYLGIAFNISNLKETKKNKIDLLSQTLNQKLFLNALEKTRGKNYSHRNILTKIKVLLVNKKMYRTIINLAKLTAKLKSKSFKK